MCGIAGFLGPWSDGLLAGMVAALRHRGPDGDGVWRDAAASVGLVHTRLAIIDPTAAAAQPMHSADGRYAITFNGEIYNYRELRAELADSGVVFQTRSDTEVLLASFIRHGPECLDRLNGIFAFAIWDSVERRLFLARDPLGVKPLYYAELPQGFLFASEIKALTLCPDLGRDIDPLAVADHLGFLWTAGEATMLAQARKLRPGHWMRVDHTGVERRRYYQPVPDAPPMPSSPAPAQLTGLLDRVVRDQMVADVEIGALLSGGIDSSAVVASMCAATDPSKITAFCAVVPKVQGGTDNFGDDRTHARDVAENLGIRLVEVPTEADLIADLPEMVWMLDEPTADAAPLQLLMLAREAKRNGIKVLLSGTGGDDIFTGYGRHTAALAYARAARVPGLRRLIATAIRGFPPTSIVGRRLRRMGELFTLDEDEMLLESMSYSSVLADGRAALLAPDIRATLPARGAQPLLRDCLDATRGRHPVDRLLALEINGFLPDHNLNYADKMAMQTGVEVRVPLIDTRLVAFAAALPVARKIDMRWTKKILRESQRGRLPDGVLSRAKQGFGVPVRAWLAGPARDMLEELTSARAVGSRGLFDADSVARLKSDFYARRIDAAFTLFSMMAIELWCRALDAAPRMTADSSLGADRAAGGG